MESIYFDLENCYGIPKFKESFKFDERRKAHLIYAPNGVMKTSFSNTINDIVLEQETKDFLYPERKTRRVVKYGGQKGKDIDKADILVIHSYFESYRSENVVALLADDKLKKKFDQLHKEIDNKTNSLVKNLNKLSGKRKAIDLLAKDFNVEIKDIHYELERLYDEYKDQNIEDFTSIKYGNIVTSDSEKILGDKDLRRSLEDYIEQYEKLLNESEVFKVAFNHTSAENVLKNLRKDGFFKANHQILLSESSKPIGEKEFKKMIEEEKKRIIDNEMTKEFNEIDKLLSGRAGARNLRDFITNNEELIPQLLKFDEFKRKLWLSYLFENQDIFKETILNFKNNKIEIKKVIEKAQQQESKWHGVVQQFNHRFSNMPFEMQITNKEDVVLKSELPSITFKYKDRGEVTDVNKEDLLQCLSNGEKKALYLLNVIFEIEARKKISNKTLLVIDDIADSFDYRNKYAIIEYLKEIVNIESFFPIMLTHNFDFYRTVAGRLSIKGCSNFVVRTDEEITLIKGEYFENVFRTWGDQVYKDDTILLSSIAFVRNLTEYIEGNDSEIYQNLTSLLHYKKFSIDGIKSTEEILVGDLIDWCCSIWGREDSRFERDRKQSVYELLLDEANKIIRKDIKEEGIEYKIVLSIVIRLKTEIYMINRINDDEVIKKIKGYQTRRLKEMIELKDTPEDNIIDKLIEKALIITSENIHINSFMYEPIVDMSIEELKNLYKEINAVMEELVVAY